MDVKYQVFISSTFDDLQQERRLITEQILNLGYIPVGMELFQAANDSQWEYIKRRILDCDYYIVVVAERYGSMSGAKSYTQLEYEYASANGIPVAAFLLDDNARTAWPQGKVEPDKRDKIERFRKLCQKRLVKYWSNGDDLKAKVATTIVELVREVPRVGWVRGDAVATPAALTEIARLSEERRTLQERMQALEARDGQLSLPPDIQHRLVVLNELVIGDFLDNTARPDMSFLELFRNLHKKLAVGIGEYVLVSTIQTTLGLERNSSVAASAPVMEHIVAEFVSNELVDFDTVTVGERSTMQKLYRLTDYGKRFLMYADLWETGAFEDA